jgi:hypothetical protein
MVNLFLVQISIACQTEFINAKTPLLVATVNTDKSKSTTTLDDGPQLASTLTHTEECVENSTLVTIEVDYQSIISQSPASFGTNGYWSDQDAEMWRTRYAELEPTVVRLPALQGMLEPQNDDTDPDHINRQGFLFDQPFPWLGRTVTFRKWLETLRDQDITIMIHVPYLAGWLSANEDRDLYSTYPPRDIAEYREYLLALLTFVIDELDYPPERVILEPINEPDLDCGQDPNVPCFWENWQMDDLVKVMRTANEVAMEVDPDIHIVGVAECCGTALVETLMNDYDGQSLLDGLTYHHYVSGENFRDGLIKGQRLAAYGKPVYINEYGNTQVWSNGTPGALWHAATLPQIWAAGINPIQFPISEFPGTHEGYNQLGLFYDWRDDWEIKSTYWVYTNFYNYFGDTELVSIQEIEPLVLLAGRKLSEDGNPLLVIWVTNPTSKPQDTLRLEIDNFPVNKALAQVYDNLLGPDPITNIELKGPSILIDLQLPAASSYSIVLQTSNAMSTVFAPIVAQNYSTP